MVLVSLVPKTNPSWKESGFAAWSQWFRWVYTGNDLIMANHNVTPHNAYLDLTYCLLLSSLISVPLTFPENKQVHIREKWHTQLQASPAVQAGAPILQADTTSSSTARMSPVAHEGALNLRPFIEETPQWLCLQRCHAQCFLCGFDHYRGAVPVVLCWGSRSVTPPRPGPSGGLGVPFGFGQVPPFCLSVIVYSCPL